MRTCVFCGPSLQPQAMACRVPGVTAYGPVRRGDVYLAVRAGFERIALVDGYFDQALPVWHKEILFALEQGRQVFGAASLGALRAAELDIYGMIGVGCVYGWFRDGELEDDDEVAVLHEPASHGYRARSDAMVSLRATLARMRDAGVLGTNAHARWLAFAKATHYTERNLRALLRQADARSDLAADTGRMRDWLGSRWERFVDVKRDDALLLAARLREDTRGLEGVEPPRLARTEAWIELARRCEDERRRRPTG